jgi:TIR domain
MAANLHAIVGEVVRQCLAEGANVKLDGLGVFRLTESGVEFRPATGPRVFIAYVIEDYHYALRLYKALAAAGFNPWLDRKKLLPGQNWRRCIERSIDNCDFFVACFSSASVRKRGQFPYEVRYALRTAERMPLDDMFIVPVRLEECEMPRRISWNVQYVDLFPDWEDGLDKLIGSIRAEWANRSPKTSR